MARFMPLGDAISEYLSDGQSVAFEGFSHLIPFAAAHETIRQGHRDLHLIRMTPDLVYDQMVGMGCARSVTFSYIGNPGIGLLRRMRDAIENGWPNSIEVCELSHAALANAYQAGASALPCAVFRGYQGVELPRVNDSVRFINCPFSGEKLAAVRSVRVDCAVIHAQKADHAGNVQIDGITGVQKEAVLSATRALVTVEEVVHELNAHPNACILPSWQVDAVCVVPGGAHPSYAFGYYDRDDAFYREWERISAGRSRFLAWMQRHVMDQSPEIFESRVSGQAGAE